MLAHLLKSAVRSLAATVVLGSILIYATGGLGSPNARGMIGVIAICFFLFWVTFIFMFGPRVPKHQDGRDEHHLDSATHVIVRGRRRHETDDDTSESSTGEAGGGD